MPSVGTLLACFATAFFVPQQRLSLIPSPPRGRIAMNLFPEGQPSPIREIATGRNQRVATLLTNLVGASPAEQASILEHATDLLLAPFLADTQAEGSIFSDGMSMEEKVLAYRLTLTDRIESARSEEVADALRKMRDHTLRAVEDKLVA